MSQKRFLCWLFESELDNFKPLVNFPILRCMDFRKFDFAQRELSGYRLTRQAGSKSLTGRSWRWLEMEFGVSMAYVRARAHAIEK